MDKITAQEIAGLLRELNVDGFLDDGALAEAANRFGEYLKTKIPDFDIYGFYFTAVES
jgi:hypothetical protein